MLEVRAATRADLDSAAECIGEAFGGGDPARYDEIRATVALTAKDDPFARLEDLRVGVLDGEVVSAAAVLPRPVHMGGAVLSMGGIAAVCTRESHRGAGHNTAVLRDALAYIEGEGHDISLLYTGIHGYYERLGWRSFGHGVGHHMEASSELRAAGFSGAIRPMRPSDDLPAVQAIYDAANQGKAGPVARNAALWAHHRGRLAAYRVAVVDETVVAYAHLSDRRIEEMGSAPGHEAAEVALVVDVLERGCREDGPVYLCGGEHVLDAIGQAGCAVDRLGGEPEGDRGPTMYRIMRLAPLVAKLLPAMAGRLAASPAAELAGVVRLQSEVGCVDLQYDQGSVTLGDGSATPSITLDASHAQTIELVFGQVDPVSLITHATGPAEATEQVLAALFPRLTYAYYGPDTF